MIKVNESEVTTASCSVFNEIQKMTAGELARWSG